MAKDTSIPVDVHSDAANRVAKLGMQAVLARLLDHTRQSVTGLQEIRVELASPHDTGGDEAVVIEATRDPVAHAPNDATVFEWGRWFVATFPPEVRQHFSFVTVYARDHAR